LRSFFSKVKFKQVAVSLILTEFTTSVSTHSTVPLRLVKVRVVTDNASCHTPLSTFKYENGNPISDDDAESKLKHTDTGYT
jgi:hypothetical protein